MSLLTEVPYLAGRLSRRLMPGNVARRYLTNDFDDLRHLVQVHEGQVSAVDYAAGELAGETVLEIGPGRYNPAAVGFLGQGAARVVFVERARRNLDQGLLQQRIRDLMAAFGYCGAEWQRVAVLDPGETRELATFGGGRIEFRWQSATATGLPDNSVGAIFSHSVLQCLNEPQEVFKELARVLKPGGFMYHMVDLRDHFFRFPLQFLCYSEYMWSHVLTSRYPHKAYLNRLRLPQLQRMFEELGLEVETRALAEDVEAVRRLRPRMHGDFQGFTDDELAPMLAGVYCWK
ncbi:MAG: methyltransferase domain-containing protein [Armatimonadia bacterium]